MFKTRVETQNLASPCLFIVFWETQETHDCVSIDGNYKRHAIQRRKILRLYRIVKRQKPSRPAI